MAYVDRNSKKIHNRLLMFLLDVYVLIRGKDKANLVETINEVTQKRS